ncbi:hypothetical protein FRB96_006203 [Tulasnella sp. 330]|nr:hypothetical protein FRB96_006203 [Tulasnella sp. 330]
MSSSSATQSSLFRNAHNVPLKCFIQRDIGPDIALHLEHTLETHGGLVTRTLDDALVILVDPPTPGGQLLTAEFGSNTSRAILDFGWVDKCMEMRRCVGPGDNWGGHRLPYTNVHDFFSTGPPAPSEHPPMQQQQPYPSRHSSFSPRTLTVFQHDRDMERDAYTKAAVSAPPRPIAFQPGSRAQYSMSGESNPRPAQSRHLGDGHIQSGGGGSSSSITESVQARGGAPILWSHHQSSSTSIGAPHHTASPDAEPTAPDASQIIMHHNGMGAKFTDADSLFIRAYFRWSLKHHPDRTNRQILDCLHAKMPHHSVVSTAQYIRRHPDWFPSYIRKEHSAGQRKRLLTSTTGSGSSSPDMRMPAPTEPYDPTLTGDDGCPLPPRALVPSGPGFRFTPDDTQWVIAFFNWYVAKHPDATRAQILRELTARAPHRTLPSWQYFFQKNQEKWRPLIKGLRDISEDHSDWMIEGGGPIPSTSTGPTPKLSVMERPDVDFHVTGSDNDSMGDWDSSHPQATRTRMGLSKSVPLMPREDYEWDERDSFLTGRLPVPDLSKAPGPVRHSSPIALAHHKYRGTSMPSLSTSSSARPVKTHFVGEGMTKHWEHHSQQQESATSSTHYFNAPIPVKPRRSDYGTRRMAKPFTSQEKLTFIDFLAGHPSVWTHASVDAEWLKDSEGVSALAIWQKFAKIQPQRSDACWREYHKRNALELDTAAKRLRIGREAGEPNSAAQGAIVLGRHQQKEITIEMLEEDFEVEDHKSVAASDDYEDEDYENDVEEKVPRISDLLTAYRSSGDKIPRGEDADGDEMETSGDEMEANDSVEDRGPESTATNSSRIRSEINITYLYKTVVRLLLGERAFH